MKAIVIGGGKVGYYLLKTLKDKGYNLTLIEKNLDLCNKIAEEMEIDIICGDGTDIDVLKDAGVEKAEIVATVTGKDEGNFIICQIININFPGINTIARINNPKNRALFKALGIDKTVCSTEVISNLIESELNNSKIRVVQTLDRGEMILVETIIKQGSKWRNKLISNIPIPEGCIIVSIFRNDKLIFPKGSIEIREEDRVLVAVDMEKRLELENSI